MEFFNYTWISKRHLNVKCLINTILTVTTIPTIWQLLFKCKYCQFLICNNVKKVCFWQLYKWDFLITHECQKKTFLRWNLNVKSLIKNNSLTALITFVNVKFLIVTFTTFWRLRCHHFEIKKNKKMKLVKTCQCPTKRFLIEVNLQCLLHIQFRLVGDY